MNIDQEDFDVPDEEERQVAARRLFTYSVRALRLANQVQKVFVTHPHFKEALSGCDRIFQLSRELSMQQGAVVAGPTGVGKTALIRYFKDSLPSSSLFERGLGAIAVRVPKRPSVGHLVARVLYQFKYPFPVTTHTLAARRDAMVDALRQKGTRLLFLDEAHHLKGQTRLRTRDVYTSGSSATEWIRELMDEVPVGVCLCGNEELFELGQIDDSLDGRVSARFKLSTFENDTMWRAFVRSFVKRCNGFDLTLLDSAEEATRLHKATGGNLRAFKRLVVEAVLVAVDANASAVEGTHLLLAFSRVSGGFSVPGSPYAQ
jgi:type II secretory pathway predicted ATPase ExeA